MMDKSIVESIAYERGINKYKTNFSKEDMITAQTSEMVVNWAKDYHPEVIEKIRNLVEENMNDENAK
tara:strand:- start:484 stop:684 length:201 start_codon:yes stop_codon:yes gene_type:complete